MRILESSVAPAARSSKIWGKYRVSKSSITHSCILLLLNIWVISSSGLSWKSLYKYVCRRVLISFGRARRHAGSRGWNALIKIARCVSNQQRIRILVGSQLYQHLVLSAFWILIILGGDKWNHQIFFFGSEKSQFQLNTACCALTRFLFLRGRKDFRNYTEYGMLPRSTGHPAGAVLTGLVLSWF